MDLKENHQLIQFYLNLLKLRKQEFINNYKPTSWELLSSQEQRTLALFHLEVNRNKDFAQKIRFKLLLKEYKEKKKSLYLKRKSEFLIYFSG